MYPLRSLPNFPPWLPGDISASVGWELSLRFGRGHGCPNTFRSKVFPSATQAVCELRNMLEVCNFWRLPGFHFLELSEFPTLRESLMVAQMCGEFIILALLLISHFHDLLVVYHLPQTKIRTLWFPLPQFRKWVVYLGSASLPLAGSAPWQRTRMYVELHFQFFVFVKYTSLCCLYNMLRHTPHICCLLLFGGEDKSSTINSECSMMWESNWSEFLWKCLKL